MTDKLLKERYIKAKRAIIDRYLSESLNPMQAEAVKSVNGPVLIVAGAGSGKTTVLVKRISFIIKYGDAYYSDDVPVGVDEAYVRDMEYALANMPPEVLPELMEQFAQNPCPPYAMLAITFTNKAAKEIKERLAKTFDNSSMSDEIWAGTFHSICVRILRKFAQEAGYQKDFTIYDTDDKKHAIADVMKALNISDKFLQPKTVANEISSAKDRLIKPQDYDTGENSKGREIKRIYEEYQRKLRACNALDFDDIIAETVYLLSSNSEVASYCQNKFRYVCVDEYQDTNYAQFRLAEIISRKNRNIMVVGDDDQSIYKFRGATIENILNFDKTYTDARVIRLEQNYRSTKNILDAANAVISHNGNRHKKNLWSTHGDGEKIIVHTARDQNDESRYIADTITKFVAEGKYAFRDFAVLYRVNEASRSLETAFARSGMPYRILGGVRFYDKKEIKDIIAYLHVIANDRDNQRLKRIINEPKRKIGATTVDAVEALAAESDTHMMQIMRESKGIMLLSKNADKLTAFTDMIDSFRMANLTVSELIVRVFEDSGYKQMLINGGEVEKPRIDAVEELVSAAKEYEARNEGATLSGFLEEVSLISDVDKYDENADAVVFMTVHSAKGLEFPVVFLAAMEENIFPSSQSMYEEEELSEERRLAYVAITRAKERLYITHASMRLLYGHTCMNSLSRFIEKEVPEKLLYRELPKKSFGAFTRQGGYGNKSATYSYDRPAPGTEEKARRAEYTYKENLSREFLKKVQTTSEKPKKPESFGVEKFPIGTRVSHAVFGDGKIVSLREMGGDMLYEVTFDSGVTKKLMATYAKLKKI